METPVSGTRDLPLKPTPENVALWRMSGGFCINCYGSLGGYTLICDNCAVIEPSSMPVWRTFDSWYRIVKGE